MRVSTFLFSGLLLAAGSWLAQPAQAQHAASTATTGTIQFSGAVFSDTGMALPGATVTPEGQIVNIGTANAEGFFVVNLPKGRPARLIVAAPDHETQLIELRRPEQEKNLVVTLVSQSESATSSRRPGGNRRRL